MATWFTADLHFGNLFLADKRGFASARDMDHTLVSKWNQKVQPGDTVYLLGDVSNLPCSQTKILLSELQGSIHLLLGNYDTPEFITECEARFSSIQYYKTLTLDSHLITLFHFPLASWEKSQAGAFHLHGHMHGHLHPLNTRRKDIGVDCNYLTPCLWEEVRNELLERSIKMVPGD